jgi:cytochrome c oxidase cbb3-type subunit I/II
MTQTLTQTSPELANEPQGVLESFKYDDQIVRYFLTAMLVWGVVAFLVGLYAAVQLIFPESAFGLSFLTFGRLRPLHTNAAIFAFAGNAIFAAIYYSSQRLLKTRMWSDVLSKLHFWGWQLIILLAAITLPLGISQSKEYAELEWPIDVLIAVVWLGFFGVNFFMTLLVRRERHMYVAIWFYIATIVTVTILHVFNNLVVPAGLFKSYSMYAGVQDAFMQWWYGHNAVAFFLTTPFLGLMYYFLPKAAERPVFSYRLSILHFWSLVFIYIWAGPHHLHYTATPDWASTLGMLFSLMLWMPSWGGMINGLLTLRGAWHKVTTDPVLKFFVVGITFYGMSTFEGPLLSIKAVNSLSHYTDWTIAHVHSGALGWNGFMAFGMMYWLLPRLFQAPLHSKKLAEWHFWLGTIGILLYIVPIYVAGITQGLMWRALNPEGGLMYPDFVETTRAIIPMYYLRVLGGTLFIAGAVLGCWNYFKTWQARPKVYEEPIITAPRLSAVYLGDPERPAPTLRAVTDSAKRLQVFNTMWWHRKWERLPIKFTVLTTVAVLIASLFEIIPTFLIRSNIPTIATVTPYTPLELYGRDVYISEGCYNCHSQMIRPIVAETKRYGEYSKPGESVYDRPFQWGSRRIGPDLARVGGKNSHDWHIRHFADPSGVTPGSIMPPYPWLLNDKIDWKSIPVRIRALQALGVPYTDEDRLASVDAAKAQMNEILQVAAEQAYPTREGDSEELKAATRAEQEAYKKRFSDKQVIALIAYVQRLGIDLYKTEPTPVIPAPANTEPPAVATREGGN